jgi:hypothetical protein
MATDPQSAIRLVPGRTYTWDEIGTTFDFKPRYLSVAGGMMPRPRLDALVLVTWPGGARSFNYEDYWSRGDLIYTGRGKIGDQKLGGANRFLAENRYTNYVFEGGVGSGMLKFLGTAIATRHWRARGLGDDGNERGILRYKLRFQTGGASTTGTSRARRQRAAGAGRRRSTAPAQQQRQRRRFDPSRPPTLYRTPVQHATPEETAARREKANQGHHALLPDRHDAGLPSRTQQVEGDGGRS